MSDLAPPPPEPERKPTPEDRPVMRVMKDYPEITDQLRYPPEPKPKPFQKPEEEPTKLKNTLTSQPPPTLGMNGLVSYTNRDSWKPPGQEPQQQPEKQPEPVPDILAEARRRLAERGQADEARERPSGLILELRKPEDGRQL